jgi:hypothetical protein
MNNQQVGYIFAEKFNSESVNYGTGFNPLRGKGYSASVRDLVFDEQFYGDPQYGGAEYGGNSEGYYIRWMFTSSLTQSFYDANPGISPDENLYVLYQNYIPTGSGSTLNHKTVIQYTTYIPLGTQNFVFPPTNTNFKYTITGEYYSIGTPDLSNSGRSYLRFGTGSTEITSSVLSQLGDFPGNSYIDQSDPSGIPSGSFVLTASADSPQLSIRVTNRYTSTGSVFVLRNLKITYPVDSTIFEPFAQTQDLHLQTDTGLINSRYEGCKMTSPDFNVDSPDTIDGGPVVTVTTVNPNLPVKGDIVPKKKISQQEVKANSLISGKGNFKIK